MQTLNLTIKVHIPYLQRKFGASIQLFLAYFSRQKHPSTATTKDIFRSINFIHLQSHSSFWQSNWNIERRDKIMKHLKLINWTSFTNPSTKEHDCMAELLTTTDMFFKSLNFKCLTVTGFYRKKLISWIVSISWYQQLVYRK